MDVAIKAEGLRKQYGDLWAVDGVDLEIEPGECFALLGPNGAGKTTTTEMLEGYRQRTGGDIRVLGEDPAEAGAGRDQGDPHRRADCAGAGAVRPVRR